MADDSPSPVEARKAHDSDAATAEILRLIRDSRGDEQPVFDAILRHAQLLCGSPTAALVLARPTDPHPVLVAHRGVIDEVVALYDAGAFTMDPRYSFTAQAVTQGRPIHVRDMAESAAYREGQSAAAAIVERLGIRTNLFVPLMAAEGGIGCIIIFRDEVRPYEPEQIALVERFAAQAVIAIENARQFRELQARLEREQATREILQVISRSREDERPVFDAILGNAARLCDAPLALLCMTDEARTHVTVPAFHGARDAFAASMESFREPLDAVHLLLVRPIAENRVVRVTDIADDAMYRDGNSYRVRLVDTEGIRSFMAAPLISDGVAIGAIVLYRREVAPFSDDAVSLVEGFAEQAVIAIENVRQFRELQTRLARERASAEILELISRSRDDERPVFEAIFENARRLCSTQFGYLCLVDAEGSHLEIVTGGAAPLGPHRPGWRFPVESDILIARAFRERRVLHLEDITADALYRAGDRDRLITAEAGVRTLLAVPLASGGRGIGAIGLYRTEVHAFSDDEIDLMKTFAAQAVIAIENVHQFRALRARTEEVQSLNASLEARVAAQVSEIERMSRLKRFMPAAVADAVVSAGSDKLLSSHRALLGVLFCDIRGFTAFCETAEPEETIDVLQTYHQEMGKLIAGHGAGVDHRMGDGIMVLFNDPLPCDDPAGEAVRLALAMRARMVELCRGWKRLGHRLGFGVGVSLGYATVGMVGYEGRYDYTASGTAVNLAARLCDEAQDGEILLSPRACAAVEDDFSVAARGAINLKGMREPVDVFRIAEPA